MGVIARPAPLALLDPIRYADGVGYVITTTDISGVLILTPDAATSPTGTGAITEAGDTSTGTGITTHTGTGAITETGDTSTGSGTGGTPEATATGIIVRRYAPTIRGQIAYADAVTIRIARSSSGVVYLTPSPVVTGIGSITEAGDTSVGVGSPGVAGTGAITEGADGISGSDASLAVITGRLTTRRIDTARTTRRIDEARTTYRTGH